MKKLLHYYLSAAMLLCSLAQTRAQGEDTYRWVEKDGVYTLAGTPKKGDIATIKVGVYYSAPENGANTIWLPCRASTRPPTLSRHSIPWKETEE